MPGGMKRQWPSLPTTTFVWYVPSNFSSALKRWTFWKNGQKRQISYQIFFMLCCWKLIEHSHSNWNLERLPLFHIQGHTSFRYKGFNASRSCTSQNIKIYIHYFKRLIFELSQESHLLSWYSNWTFVSVIGSIHKLDNICNNSNAWRDIVIGKYAYARKFEFIIFDIWYHYIWNNCIWYYSIWNNCIWYYHIWNSCNWYKVNSKTKTCCRGEDLASKFEKV